MKPKLTTNGTLLIEKVQAELTAPFSEQCALLFSVCPALGIGHCSVQFMEGSTPFLITRQWKPERQSTYYPGGIYDLNDIYIAERRIALLEEDCTFIREMKNLDLNIEKSTGIMIDGEEYTLSFNDKAIRWALCDKLEPELQEVLNKLMILAGIGY